jgi:hypothetical protein
MFQSYYYVCKYRKQKNQFASNGIQTRVQCSTNLAIDVPWSSVQSYTRALDRQSKGMWFESQSKQLDIPLLLFLLRLGVRAASNYAHSGYLELWILRYPAHGYHALPSPGFEPTTLWLRVRRSNHSATTLHITGVCDRQGKAQMLRAQHAHTQHHVM